MLKSLLLSLLLACVAPVTVFSQEKEPPVTLLRTGSGAFYYEKVIDVAGASKTELYDRVKAWVIKNIKTSDNNVIFDDANKDHISATVFLQLVQEHKHVYFARLDYKYTFSFKEGKCKVEANQFQFCSRGGNVTEPFNDVKSVPNKKMKVEYEDFDKKFADLQASLQKSVEGKDNW